ncbi:MAG: CHRD domain-containing protein [Solirubrobacteraceae bacterium]
MNTLPPRTSEVVMRRFIFCLVAVCAIALATPGVAPAKSGRGVMCVLHAKLTAAEETPPTTSAAKGHTLIKVRNDGTIEFKTQINNRNHETFVAGHIHQAPVGVAGPIVVPLFVSPAPQTSARHIKQSGVATPNAGTTGAALCQNPSAYYVNYHTTVFPNGAIRGQLR